MDGTSSRQCYTREDVMALLDGDGDLDIDDHNLDDIFYPGSDEEGFVLDDDTNEGGSDGGSEHSDSDEEDPEDLHR